jgi:alcohol dehydrogenase class IV
MDATDGSHGGRLEFTAPPVTYGDGVAGELPAVLDRLGIERPLAVTDDGVADAGIADRVLAPLGEPPLYRAATEPSTAAFEELPADDVDGLVAVGGGSVLDTAKLLSALLAHGGDAADYLGVDAVPGPTLPVVAVPTTSGTGSQATQTAVLAHEGVKRGASDERLRPAAALVDPALTFDLPRATTARSGFDSFVHALESLTARDHRWVPERPIRYQGATPVSRPLSRRALGLVHGALERAVLDGGDREARRAMSLGSHLAGLAFSNAGLGAVHALASTVGGLTGRPHGDCLAVSFEPGLAYNRPVRERQYAGVARELGLVEGATDRTAADALLAAGDRLAATLDLPRTFADVGLDRGDLDAMVANTLLQERRLATNPRTVGEDIEAVLADRL